MTAPLATRRQLITARVQPRLVPRDELVNTLQFESQAERVLPPDVARTVAGSDRAPFDRITLRPRMMVDCTGLDLSTELLGASLFAPIIVGPVAEQRRFHAQGELATVRGASAAKAAIVLSARSSSPIEAMTAEASTPVFYQVFASESARQNQVLVQAAERAGCRAVLITLGEPEATRRRLTRADWSAVDALRRAVNLPIVVKGVTTVADARLAVEHGAQAVVVSNYGQPAAPDRPASLDVLPSIVDALDGRAAMLVDGGIRRGTDIMKALALGARAVLVARPVMWGLAAYGAEGVQAVLEMLQTELGRVMGCCGKPNLAAIDRAVLKVHAARAGAGGRSAG